MVREKLREQSEKLPFVQTPEELRGNDYSEMNKKLHNFLDYCKDKWGFCRKVYVDNADQATMMELRKYKQQKRFDI